MFNLVAMLGSRALWRALPYILGAAVVGIMLFKAYSWAYDRGYAKGEAIYTKSIQDAATAYADAAARQQATIDALTADLATARRRSAGLSGRLEGTLANDPPSRDWGAVRVPDAVRRLLDEAGSPDLPADP